MKSNLFFFVFSFVFNFLSNPSYSSSLSKDQTAVSKITYLKNRQQFNDLISYNQSNPGNILWVKFGALWCGPCRSLENDLKKFAPQNNLNIAFIDVDQDSDLSYKIGFKGGSIPLSFIYLNGVKVKEESGYANRDANRFKKYLLSLGMKDNDATIDQNISNEESTEYFVKINKAFFSKEQMKNAVYPDGLDVTQKFSQYCEKTPRKICKYLVSIKYLASLLKEITPNNLTLPLSDLNINFSCISKEGKIKDSFPKNLIFKGPLSEGIAELSCED